MKLSTLQTLAAVGAAGILGLASASAAEPRDSSMYFKFDAGANFVQDTDGSRKAPATPTVLFESEFDPGFRVGLGAGYNLNRYLGLELESGFLYNEIKDTDSWLGQVPFLANVVVRYQNASRFVPYIGGGAGAVIGILDLEELDDSDSQALFAWQGLAGLNYKISDTTSVGLAYKYLGTESSNYDVAGFRWHFSEVHNHSVNLVFNWQF